MSYQHTYLAMSYQHIYLATLLLPVRLAEFTGAAVRVRRRPGWVDKGVPGSDGTVLKGGPVERTRGLGAGVATGSSVPCGLPRTRSIRGRSSIGSGSNCSYGRPPGQESVSGMRLASAETEVAVPTGRASEAGASPGSAGSDYGDSWPHCGPRRGSVGSGGWSWPCP